MSTLVEGYTISEVLYGLYSKVEIFKHNCSEQENDFIQSVFDYFSNYENRTPRGVVLFIKIIMHFYHENLFLAMRKDCIKIPYKLNQCYIVPSIEYGNHQYLHDNEGNFIKALLKMPNAFEEKVVKQQILTQKEKAQLKYAVIAIFDFLPLPANANNRKRNPNPSKDRYEQESNERLASISATHLLFVFEAYPFLFQKYHQAMVDSFCTYVSNGVKDVDLCQAVGVKDFAELFEKLTVNDDAFGRTQDMLYQELITNNAGFAQQYRYQPDFLNNLKKNISEKLEARIALSDYVNKSIDNSHETSSESHEQPQEMEDINITESLFRSYFYQPITEQTVKPLTTTAIPLADINLDRFKQNFRMKFAEKLQGKFTEFKGLRIAKIIQQALSYRMQDPKKFLEIQTIARQAISETYFEDKKDDSFVTVDSQENQVMSESSVEEKFSNPHNEIISTIVDNSSPTLVHDEFTSSSESTSEVTGSTTNSTIITDSNNEHFFQGFSCIALEEAIAVFENYQDAKIFQRILFKIGLTESSTVSFELRNIKKQRRHVNNDDGTEQYWYSIAITPYEWYYIQQNHVVKNQEPLLVSYHPLAATLASEEETSMDKAFNADFENIYFNAQAEALAHQTDSENEANSQKEKDEHSSASLRSSSNDILSSDSETEVSASAQPSFRLDST